MCVKSPKYKKKKIECLLFIVFSTISDAITTKLIRTAKQLYVYENETHHTDIICDIYVIITITLAALQLSAKHDSISQAYRSFDAYTHRTRVSESTADSPDTTFAFPCAARLSHAAVDDFLLLNFGLTRHSNIEYVAISVSENCYYYC